MFDGIEQVKDCPDCGLRKPVTDFYKTPAGKLGYSTRCKLCHAARGIKWRAANRDHGNRYQREHYKAHLEADPVKTKLREMCYTAKRRSKRDGVAFDIDAQYLKSILPDVCPVFGVPFKFDNRATLCPESPTLDKFHPEKGYVRGNVVIISHKANRLKGEATLKEHLSLVRWMQRVEASLDQDNIHPLEAAA